MAETRIFYGWVIILVSSIVDFIAVGFFFYSYGAFFLPIAQELGGGTRLGVSLGVTLVNVATATIAPYTGNLLDRLSIKRVMMTGILMASVGFYLLAQVHSMLQFYLVIVTFIALGTGTMGQISTAKLVTNWFVIKRGMALGIATMGISLSGMVMPPVTTWLISQFGWRGSLEIFSVITPVLLLPIVWRFVVDKPDDKGLAPDGIRRLPLEQTPANVAATRTTWRNVLRIKLFWVLAINFGLNFCVVGATLVHLIPLARDMGINGYGAASALASGAFAGVIGKVFFGTLADRSNPRLALLYSIGSQLIGLLLILLANHLTALMVGTVIFGFGMGGGLPLQSTTVATMFGNADFGKVMGLMRPVMLPLQASGALLAGWLYDLRGSYTLVFSLFIGCYLLAFFLTYIAIPKRSTGHSPILQN